MSVTVIETWNCWETLNHYDGQDALEIPPSSLGEVDQVSGPRGTAQAYLVASFQEASYAPWEQVHDLHQATGKEGAYQKVVSLLQAQAFRQENHEVESGA